jgi:hypothetical protein
MADEIKTPINDATISVSISDERFKMFEIMPDIYSIVEIIRKKYYTLRFEEAFMLLEMILLTTPQKSVLKINGESEEVNGLKLEYFRRKPKAFCTLFKSHVHNNELRPEMIDELRKEVIAYLFENKLI